ARLLVDAGVDRPARGARGHRARRPDRSADRSNGHRSRDGPTSRPSKPCRSSPHPTQSPVVPSTHMHFRQVLQGPQASISKSSSNDLLGSRDTLTAALDENKRVAVVIPAHDEEALLSATLGGIPEIVDRIIVVDDASSDGTLAHAHEAAGTDPRIEVVARDRK